MRTFAVAILSSAVALTSAQELSAAEKDLLERYVNSTLCESDMVGILGPEDFTNLEQLLSIDYWTYSPYKITSCEDDVGHWVGTQITLASNEGAEFALDPTGVVGGAGKCQTLTLTGPLDGIKAGYYTFIEAINSIRFRKDGVTKTYGDSNLNADEYEWTFSDKNRFLGLHGTTTNGIVTSFAVITDTSTGDCDKSAAIAALGLDEADVQPPVENPEVDFGFHDKKEEPVVEDDDCECISDNELETTKRNGQKVILYTDPNGIEHEYPSAYGTACIGWDEILPPTCGDGNGRPLDDQPDWCPKAWCFIDTDKCTKKDTQKSKYFPDAGLYYSYSQCNEDDTFTSWDPNA